MVYPENMKKNLEKSRGLVFSERILLELIKKGLTREEAYALVQRCAMKTWEDESLSFLEVLKKDPSIREHFSPEELESFFDYKYFLRQVDFILKRVGIEE